MIRFTCILFMFLSTAICSLQAQLRVISFDKKIEISKIIVEGKVVESRPFYAPDSMIYTANKIQVYKRLKGELREEYLSVITMGGRIGHRLWTSDHTLELAQGHEGIFFLTDSRRPTPDFQDYNYSFYQEMGMQGFLQYTRNYDGSLYASGMAEFYTDIQKDVFNYIEQRTGQTPLQIGTPRSGIRYAFKNVSSSPGLGYVEFDIYANTLYENRKLQESQIVSSNWFQRQN